MGDRMVVRHQGTCPTRERHTMEAIPAVPCLRSNFLRNVACAFVFEILEASRPQS